MFKVSAVQLRRYWWFSTRSKYSADQISNSRMRTGLWVHIIYVSRLDTWSHPWGILSFLFESNDWRSYGLWVTVHYLDAQKAITERKKKKIRKKPYDWIWTAAFQSLKWCSLNKQDFTTAVNTYSKTPAECWEIGSVFYCSPHVKDSGLFFCMFPLLGITSSRCAC